MWPGFDLFLFLDDLTGPSLGQFTVLIFKSDTQRHIRVMVIGTLVEASHAILKVHSCQTSSIQLFDWFLLLLFLFNLLLLGNLHALARRWCLEGRWDRVGLCLPIFPLKILSGVLTILQDDIKVARLFFIATDIKTGIRCRLSCFLDGGQRLSI